MSLNFDLSNSLDMQVVVPAGKTKVFDLDITNPYNDSIQYGVAYSMVSPTTLPSGVTIAKLSTSKNETQGLISASSTITVSIIVENTSSSSVTVNFSIITGYKNGGDLIVPTGRVIVTGEYSVGPEMVTVTLSSTSSSHFHGDVVIDGVSYTANTNETLTVPVGTIVVFNMSGEECDCGKKPGSCIIYLNGETIQYVNGSLTFEYTVTKNTALTASVSDNDCSSCGERYWNNIWNITES